MKDYYDCLNLFCYSNVPSPIFLWIVKYQNLLEKCFIYLQSPSDSRVCPFVHSSIRHTSSKAYQIKHHQNWYWFVADLTEALLLLLAAKEDEAFFILFDIDMIWIINYFFELCKISRCLTKNLGVRTNHTVDQRSGFVRIIMQIIRFQNFLFYIYSLMQTTWMKAGPV